MNDDKSRFRSRRRIPDALRGKTYDTLSEFKHDLHVEVQTEASDYVPDPVLARILGRIAKLNAASAAEVRSRAAIRSLLLAVESATEEAHAVLPGAGATPEVMVATKVLAQLLEPLTEVGGLIGRAVRAQCERSICEIGGLAPDEFAGRFDDLPVSSRLQKWIPLASEVDHRTIVFSAIEYFGALGPREFRWLAVVSLLAGGETVTFRPGRTTVAFAIEIEAKRMREAAYRCNPGWAASAEEMAELDSFWPATPLELLVSPAD
jgi:hypothetical protein